MAEAMRCLLRLCSLFAINICSPSTTMAETPTTHRAVAKPKRKEKGSWFDRLNLYCCQRIYLCVVFAALCVVYVCGLLAREVEHGLVLTWVVATLVFSSQVLTNMMIIVEVACQRNQHERFHQLLLELEVTFKLRLRQPIAMRLLLQWLTLLFGALAMLSLVGVAIFTVTVILIDDVGYFWHALFSIVTMRLRLLQLLVYVHWLRHYLQCWCAKLRQLVAFKTQRRMQLLDVNYKRLESLELLVAIKDTYTLLFDAFRLFNEFAGWSLFGIVTCYMLDCICHVYWSLLGLDGISARYNYVAGMATVVPMSVVISLMCYDCHECQQQCHVAGQLLGRLIAFRHNQRERQYCRLVHQLLLQLHQQQIVVSAQHFFSLDWQLIMSIGAAVATYLVILIQFLKC